MEQNIVALWKRQEAIDCKTKAFKISMSFLCISKVEEQGGMVVSEERQIFKILTRVVLVAVLT